MPEDNSPTPAFQTVSFEAREQRQFKSLDWKITLTPDTVEFDLANGQEHFNLQRARAEEHMQLFNDLSWRVIVTMEGRKYNLHITGTTLSVTSKNLSLLRVWMKGEQTPKQVQAGLDIRLRNTGIGFILLGAFLLLLWMPSLYIWSILLIATGIANFLVKKRAMLFVNPVVSLLVGIVGLISSSGLFFLVLPSASWFWIGWFLGSLSLIGWAIRESLYYDDYAILAKPPKQKRQNQRPEQKSEGKNKYLGLLLGLLVLVGIILVFLAGIIAEKFGW